MADSTPAAKLSALHAVAESCTDIASKIVPSVKGLIHEDNEHYYHSGE